MSKRVIIMAVAALALAVFAIPAAFAADADNPAKAWFDQMFSAKKAYVDQAVEDGRLTEQQGRAYKDHFDDMYQFHQENNFTCPMGGPGAGMGLGRGSGFHGGQGRGAGYGMGGFGSAQQAQ